MNKDCQLYMGTLGPTCKRVISFHMLPEFISVYLIQQKEKKNQNDHAKYLGHCHLVMFLVDYVKCNIN